MIVPGQSDAGRADAGSFAHIGGFLPHRSNFGRERPSGIESSYIRLLPRGLRAYAVGMVDLYFGPRRFAADLVIFDKDGTLIDFVALWAGKTAAAVEALAAAPRGTAALRADLYAQLGYDPDTPRFDRHSPVLTAPVGKLHALAAAVLYRHGWGWLDAELQVEQHFAPALDGEFDPAMVRATADLPTLFGDLRAAGVQIAVVTSDDHAPTVTALQWLGIAQHVAWVIGADDPHPHKPAPDALWAVCDAVGVAPQAAVMVGDSTTDLLMAQRAGIGLRVGVRSGLMDAATLAPLAHVVLGSVGEICVGAPAAPPLPS